MKLFIVAVVFAFMLTPSVCRAQSIGPVVSAGYGAIRAPSFTSARGWDDFSAGSFTGGVAVHVWHLVGFATRDTAFYHDWTPGTPPIPPNPIFVVDTSIPSGCRNSQNGQFAPAASC